MRRYVLDANALITNIEGRSGADKVQKLFDAAGREEAELFMSAINVGEVFSSLWKGHGETYARQAVRIILSAPLKVVDATLALALDAAEIRAKYHVSMGDCFAALTAIQKRATIVTAAPEFRRFERQIKILWLASHKPVS
jgi:predicted nucleic acid-binding protein